MTYSIKDWDQHYEKADTRKCKDMKWVAIPTDTADKKYRRITKMKDGPEIFGMWLSIVEVASKMPVRGILSDNDGDLSFEDMELIGGFPANLYEKAIKRMSSPEIGWIIDSNCLNLEENEDSECCPDAIPKKQDSILTTRQDKTRQYTHNFNLFWSSYPRRNPNLVGKVVTWELFQKIPEDQIETLLQNVKNYSDQIDHKFAKDPERFLKKDFWKDWGKKVDEPKKQKEFLILQEHDELLSKLGYEKYIEHLKEKGISPMLNKDGDQI
jgi:hypothetical protein